jgi:hypothetical protein
MIRNNMSVLLKIVGLTICLLGSAWFIGSLLDESLAQLAYQSGGKNLPYVSAWCVNHLKGVAVCDPTVTRLLILPCLCLIFYSVLFIQTLDEKALIHFLAVYSLVLLITLVTVAVVGYALYSPMRMIVSLFEADNPPRTWVQQIVNLACVTLTVLALGGLCWRLLRRKW